MEPIIQLLVQLATWGAVFTGAVVLVALHRSRSVPFLKPGIAYGAFACVLGLGTVAACVADPDSRDWGGQEWAIVVVMAVQFLLMGALGGFAVIATGPRAQDDRIASPGWAPFRASRFWLGALEAFAVAAAGLGLTYLMLVELAPEAGRIEEDLAFLNGSTVAMGFIVLAAAVGEELVYRQGLQPMLVAILRGMRAPNVAARWLAVFATSALWAYAHGGALEPAWMKYLQIFVFGVLLGWLQMRRSVAATIAAHGAFNLSLVVLGSLEV